MKVGEVGIKILSTKLLSSMIKGDLPILIDRFRKLKLSGTAPCPEDYYFGSDTPYRTPKLNSGLPLMHIHMVPSSDAVDLRSWREQIEADDGKMKTSNLALVYAKNLNDDYLLIAMLPRAHQISQMKTQEHKDIMERFALIANEFLDSDLNNY